MDEAQDFAAKHMKDYINDTHISTKDINLIEIVSHALEFPQHWREPRQEARWFLDFYGTSALAEDYVSSLLNFAKLDYNMMQSIYQDDLKYLSKWWKDTEWGEKLGFARERLVSTGVWVITLTLSSDMEGRCSIDDIYDVYGTLEELEVLTKLTER